MRCEGEPPPPQPQPSPIIVTYFRDSMYERTHTSWTRGGHEDAWAAGRELSRARLFKATAISPPTVPHRPPPPPLYVSYIRNTYTHTHTLARTYTTTVSLLYFHYFGFSLTRARSSIIIIKFVSAYITYAVGSTNSANAARYKILYLYYHCQKINYVVRVTSERNVRSINGREKRRENRLARGQKNFGGGVNNNKRHGTPQQYGSCRLSYMCLRVLRQNIFFFTITNRRCL